MFMTYWFVIFSGIFFPVFWFCPIPAFRKIWLLLACFIFHYHFAGPAGVIPIICLGVLTYFSGLLQLRFLRILTIICCVMALAFYKYTTFFLAQIVGYFSESFAEMILTQAKQAWMPLAPPLAISFFVFEFVHYLVDLQKGKKPIRSPIDFSLFSVFWPSVVSGPIKRFEQFLPALQSGCRHINLNDIQIGILRIVMGLSKKLLIADNLTGYITVSQPNFVYMSLKMRWLFVLAISFRILFDFSGYSDIAIGFARLMGIALPENFNWPYLAKNLQEFWRRWHISLSTWIRDYIYIPLGGNQHGIMRKVINGIIAFAICGLWHGAAWNFMFWGLYHGIGLVISTHLKSLYAFIPWKMEISIRERVLNGAILLSPLSWLITFIYVSIGWIYFFYPMGEATSMLFLLFKR